MGRLQMDKSTAVFKPHPAWWLYNIFLTSKAVFTAPAWAPVVAAVAKRRLTFARRLGLKGPRRFATARPVWVHSLSVGEVRSAEPFVRQLVRTGIPVVVTASTQSGFELAVGLFGDLALPVEYFPYDLVFSVRHAVARLRPSAVVIVETDIWPNFLAEMKRKTIPVHLINGRVSDRTFRRLVRFKKVAGQLFEAFSSICLQTEVDARRLMTLGVSTSRIKVTGNLKFDLELAYPDRQEIRNKWNVPGDRNLIVLGSSHPGEEEIIVTTLAPLIRSIHGPCLVVAPRDVRRAARVAERLRKAGFSVRMLGDRPPAGKQASPEAMVVDRIGILRQLYAVADVAVIGGSFVPSGGHNPLEAAAAGCPVIFGPDMSDFRQVASMLKEAGAAIQVKNPQKLGQIVSGLLKDTRLAGRMAKRGLKLIAENRGAVERTMRALKLGPDGSATTA